MQQISVISVTPEQLQNAILEGVKVQIEQLKKEYQPKESTQYLTRNEVKELLNVDLSTIHNWVKRGKLRAYGIGSRVYFKRHEVEQSIKPLNF